MKNVGIGVEPETAERVGRAHGQSTRYLTRVIGGVRIRSLFDQPVIYVPGTGSRCDMQWSVACVVASVEVDLGQLERIADAADKEHGVFVAQRRQVMQRCFSLVILCG